MSDNTPNPDPVAQYKTVTAPATKGPVLDPAVYLKGIIALLGVAATTLLGLIPPHTTLWIVLTVLAAVVTAAGVYIVPNKAVSSN